MQAQGSHILNWLIKWTYSFTSVGSDAIYPYYWFKTLNRCRHFDYSSRSRQTSSPTQTAPYCAVAVRITGSRLSIRGIVSLR